MASEQDAVNWLRNTHRFSGTHQDIGAAFKLLTDTLVTTLPESAARHDAIQKLFWSRNAAVRAAHDSRPAAPPKGHPH